MSFRQVNDLDTDRDLTYLQAYLQRRLNRVVSGKNTGPGTMRSINAPTNVVYQMIPWTSHFLVRFHGQITIFPLV